MTLSQIIELTELGYKVKRQWSQDHAYTIMKDGRRALVIEYADCILVSPFMPRDMQLCRTLVWDLSLITDKRVVDYYSYFK